MPEAAYTPVTETLAPVVGATPEEIKRRQRLAQALLEQAMGTEPLGHWTQGVGKVLQALMAGRIEKKAGEEDAAAEAQAWQAIMGGLDAGIFGGGGGEYADVPGAEAVSSAPDTATMQHISGGGYVQRVGQLINKHFPQYGHDPNVAFRLARGEGAQEGTWQSRVPTKGGGRETSYGPFQLLVGGGLGDRFIRETGLDPRDPSTLEEQVKFVARVLPETGWAPWMAAPKLGIGRWQGIGRGGPRAAGETADIPGAEPVGSAPSPDVAEFLQPLTPDQRIAGAMEAAGEPPAAAVRPGSLADLIAPLPRGSSGAASEDVPQEAYGVVPPPRYPITGAQGYANAAAPPAASQPAPRVPITGASAYLPPGVPEEAYRSVPPQIRRADASALLDYPPQVSAARPPDPRVPAIQDAQGLVPMLFGRSIVGNAGTPPLLQRQGATSVDPRAQEFGNPRHPSMVPPPPPAYDPLTSIRAPTPPNPYDPLTSIRAPVAPAAAPPVHPLARVPQPRPAPPVAPAAPAVTGAVPAPPAARPVYTPPFKDDYRQQALRQPPPPMRPGQLMQEPYSGPMSAQDFARQAQIAMRARNGGQQPAAPATGQPQQPRRNLLQALLGRGAPQGPAGPPAAPVASAAPAGGAAAPMDPRRALIASLLANSRVPDALKLAVVKSLTPQERKLINVPAGGTLVDPVTRQPVYTAPAKPGETTRPMTQEERKAYGIPDSDTRPYAIDSTGKPTLIGGAGQTINIDTIGTIPPGYELVTDPVTGAKKMQLIPGGPAAAEAEAAAGKQAATEAGKQRTTDIVTQDIDRALEIVARNPGWTTGAGGALLKNVPGTEGHDLQQLIATVQSNVGFDKLQAMREASPTGGALGAVTEKELALLQATFGSLAQSQTRDQLVANLNRVRDVYLDIVHGAGNGPARAGTKRKKWNPETGAFE
jgi:hypothetical protein